MKHLFFLPFLWLVSTSMPAIAQNSKQNILKDSALVSFSYFSPDSLNSMREYTPDTLPYLIHRYDVTEKYCPAAAHLGNSGKAYHDILRAFSQTHTGFDYGIHAFDGYLLEVNTLKYYHFFYPITELSYVMGAKREQHLLVSHHQNIGKNFFLGIEYALTNSPGAYKHLKSDNYHFAPYLEYRSKNERYKAVAGWISNLIKSQENCGISNDSLFKNNIETNREIIPVFSTTAKNRYWQSLYFFNHEFQLQKNRPQSDTVIPVNPGSFTWAPTRLRHSFRFSQQSWIYEDTKPLNNFYPLPPLDSDQTYDVQDIESWQSDIFIYNTLDPASPLSYYGMLEYQKNMLKDTANQQSLHQLKSKIGLSASLPLNLKLGMEFELVNGDYYQGDYQSEYWMEYRSKRKKTPFHAKIAYQKGENRAPWYLHSLHSNHFQFDKSFRKMNNTLIKANIEFEGIHLLLEQKQVGSAVLLSNLATPFQTDQQISLSHISISKRFHFWKLYLDGRADYQTVDKDTLIHLPGLMLKAALGFDLNLFKGALILQPGFDFYYQSAWYADAYMPPLRSFYVQYDTKIPEQFFADVFIDMKISKARIFIKYQHFNSLFGPYNYYLVPTYPVQDAGIRLGINWILRDPPLLKKSSSKPGSPDENQL